MGVVYEAADPSLDRAVALKVVLGVRGAEAIARLTREAQAVAKLSHPNVVTVYDFGNERGRPYIVMELVEGESLDGWLQTRPPWRAVAAVFALAARGLAAAHAAGLVHRDFKPANVLRSKDGSVKVLDFGLARGPTSIDNAPRGDPNLDVLGDASNLATLTQAGIALGTPPYMAPEQHRGEPVGPASDAYAFGVALYRAVTGEQPFTAANIHMLLQAKMAGLPEAPPSDQVPPRLYEIICRLTDPDPLTREQDLRRVGKKLDRIARRRRRLQWWMGGAVASVATGGALWLAAAAPPSPELAPETKAATPVDVALEAKARALIDRADMMLYEGQIARSIANANAGYYRAVEAQSKPEQARALGAIALGWRDSGGFRSTPELLQSAMEASIDAGLGLRAVRLSTEHGFVLFRSGRLEEFEEAIRETEALIERFSLGTDARVRAWALMLKALANKADVEDSRAAALEAVRILREAGELAHPALLARALRQVALYEIELQPDEARVHSREARALFATVQGDSGPGTLRSDQTITEVNRALGDYRGCLERAAIVYSRASGPTAGVKPDSAMLAASCATALDDDEATLLWTDRAAELESAGLMTIRQQMALANRVGTTYEKLGRLDDAEAAYLRSLVLAESLGDTNIRSRLLMNLHGHYEARDMDLAASNTFADLLRTVEHEGVPDAVRREAWVRSADRLIDANKFDEARETLDRAAKLEALPNTRDRANAARATYLRGRIAYAAGDTEEGLKLARTGLTQLPADRAVDGIRDAITKWINASANGDSAED